MAIYLVDGKSAGYNESVATMQIDRKQAGKNVLLHFIAPARLLQMAQPPQVTAQPAAQHPSFLSFLKDMAHAIRSCAHPAGVLLSWWLECMYVCLMCTFVAVLLTCARWTGIHAAIMQMGTKRPQAQVLVCLFLLPLLSRRTPARILIRFDCDAESLLHRTIGSHSSLASFLIPIVQYVKHAVLPMQAATTARQVPATLMLAPANVAAPPAATSAGAMPAGGNMTVAACSAPVVPAAAQGMPGLDTLAETGQVSFGE